MASNCGLEESSKEGKGALHMLPAFRTHAQKPVNAVAVWQRQMELGIPS
ncbi:uncharacterized protein G2W53_025996 [Senna tora]|uniref:Uncharacterized protein n=1 Tax=Senna tora TaxID=362788 RepID=A0A834TFZ2_9FABA|nr:uncharacterized protein G2W53_025996 [Senna tora]